MKRFILILTVCMIGIRAFGQVEGVIVEKYYVSDSIDMTDPVAGSVLQPGSVTYRVYIDLSSSSSLLGLFSDAGHSLQFRSTEPFYNHASGSSTPYLTAPISYQEYTAGLDSWITLGQIATRNQLRFCGVLKTADSNGNYFAGALNDGGMLSNNDPTAGIPLTIADGMDTMRNIIGSSSWGYNLPDSSIFGPTSNESEFISNSASIQCDGARGNDTDNLVLVAQLTTAGELSFKLNLRVLEVRGTDTINVDYVSQLATGEVPSVTLVQLPALSYPPVCGCTDPRFLEYSSQFTCSVTDSCRNLVRYGCLDTAACNYDPSANFNLPTLCCYPGFCNDRDLEVVCPQLALGRNMFSDLQLGPNPVQSSLIVSWFESNGNTMELNIIDFQGRTIRRHSFNAEQAGGLLNIDISDLEAGVYLLRIDDKEASVTRRIIKL